MSPGWRANRTQAHPYAGHVLMENRNGLVAHSCLTHARTAERDAALALVDRMAPARRITLGADKG